MDLRGLLNNLKKKLGDSANQAASYFNPESNGGKNFWSTSAAQGLANVQPYAQPIGAPLASLYKEAAPSVTKIGQFTNPLTQIASRIPGSNIPVPEVPKFRDLVNTTKMGVTGTGLALTPGFALAGGALSGGINAISKSGDLLRTIGKQLDYNNPNVRVTAQLQGKELELPTFDDYRRGLSKMAQGTPEALGTGVVSSAQLGALSGFAGTVLKPLFSALNPNEVSNALKFVQESQAAGKSTAFIAKTIAQNLGTTALKGGIPMGALTALDEASKGKKAVDVLTAGIKSALETGAFIALLQGTSYGVQLAPMAMDKLKGIRPGLNVQDVNGNPAMDISQGGTQYHEAPNMNYQQARKPKAAPAPGMASLTTEQQRAYQSLLEEKKQIAQTLADARKLAANPLSDLGSGKGVSGMTKAYLPQLEKDASDQLLAIDQQIRSYGIDPYTGRALSTMKAGLSTQPTAALRDVTNPKEIAALDAQFPSKQQELSTSTRKALTGTPIKERGFITSVKGAENTPKSLKSIVEGTYVPTSTKELTARAKELIRVNPELAERIAVNPQNSVDVEVGNQLIARYVNQGDLDKAKQIVDGMAQSGTELGQAVQAFANYDKTSPAGALKYAQQQVNAYNKIHADSPLKLDDKAVSSIFKQAEKIQAMPMGRERNIASNALMEKVNDLIPSSVVDKAITVWKAGLLTSLRTHERNLLGNSVMGVAETVKDLPASLADMALGTSTGKRSLTFTVQGAGEGAQKGFQRAGDVVKYGYDPEEAITKFDVRHVSWGKNPFEQALKKYTDVVFRTLSAEDKPFWNSAYARSLYDQAGAEAINAGKAGNAKFIESLVKSPSENMLKNAVKDANIATFHDANTLGKLATSAKNALSQNELTKLGGEIFAPFTGVPSSIAGKVIDYSPVGLGKGVIDAGKVLSGSFDSLQRQASQEIGRGVVGTGIMALGALLAKKGLVSGNPKDAAEARQWQLENKPNNAVLLFGKWRGINSIGPQSLVFLAGAKVMEALHQKKGFSETIGQIAAQTVKDFTQQTFLQGVQQPLGVIFDPQMNKPERYLGSQAASAIPNIVKDTAKAFDPLVRENNNFMDYLQNAIPGIRNQNIGLRDALGNQIRNESSGINAYIDLFNSRSPIHNLVVDELSRLNEAGFNATPSKLDKGQTIKGVKMSLTPEQLDVLESKIGPAATESLALMFETKGYQQLDDEAKKEAISSILTKVRKQIRGTIDINAPALEGSTNVPETGAVKAADSTSSTQRTFMLINPETGSSKEVNLDEQIDSPQLTGNATIDKQLMSDYRSSLTAKKKDIIALYQQGDIDLATAEKLINDLTAKSDAAKAPKKPKKISIKAAPKMKMISVSSKKLTPPKITAPKYSRPKAIASVGTIKITKPKLKDTKLRISRA